LHGEKANAVEGFGRIGIFEEDLAIGFFGLAEVAGAVMGGGGLEAIRVRGVGHRQQV
jgi:hypothetical protein